MTNTVPVPAPTGAFIIKPAILRHPSSHPPYTEMGWCSLSETMLMAMQITESMPEGSRFHLPTNIGEFMRRFWLICRLFDRSDNDIVPFCMPDGSVHNITLRCACEHVPSEEASDISREHPLFRQVTEQNLNLLIPATFPKHIRAIVLRGGDAVHGCGLFTDHVKGMKGIIQGPLLVRLAVESELRAEPVYAVFDLDWHKTDPAQLLPTATV